MHLLPFHLSKNVPILCHVYVSVPAAVITRRCSHAAAACYCCVALVLADDDRMKRGLSMLRMGKRDMGFMRMGRAFTIPPLVPPSYILPDNMEEREVSLGCTCKIAHNYCF